MLLIVSLFGFWQDIERSCLRCEQPRWVDTSLQFHLWSKDICCTSAVTVLHIGLRVNHIYLYGSFLWSEPQISPCTQTVSFLVFCAYGCCYSYLPNFIFARIFNQASSLHPTASSPWFDPATVSITSPVECWVCIHQAGSSPEAAILQPVSGIGIVLRSV